MATQTPDSIFSVGLVLQGRYRLDEALAAGGMAEVWRAHDLVLQRPVAVKLLHPHLANDPTVVERFRREAISAARLSHPHIVPTYDAGTDGDATYIVLGLISGATLAQAAAETPLSQRQAVSITRQIADAVEYAHRAGIVHRDIKPGNVLVVDDDYRVMVSDFGIAKAVADSFDESLTMPGLVVGTPAYLAPEQAEGHDADVRSDVYSIGVVLHELLCGHVSTDLPTQLAAPIAGQAPAAMLCPDLPPSLAAIVAKATAARPEDRYQSAAELHQALEQYETTVGVADRERPGATHKVRIAPPRPPRPAAPRSTPIDSDADTNEHEAIAVPVDPNPTMAQPVAPPRDYGAPAAAQTAPGFASAKGAKRRTVVLIFVVIVLIAGAAVGGRLLATVGNGRKTTTSTSVATAPAAAFTGASSFDPQGDGTENAAAAANVLDDNPSTTWSTERYNSRTFGNLKAGVGLILTLPSAQTLPKLTLTTTSTGWAASVYVASAPQTSLAAWGNSVDTQSGLGTTATFDLHNANGAAVLVWFTDLGDANRVTVADAALSR